MRLLANPSLRRIGIVVALILAPLSALLIGGCAKSPPSSFYVLTPLPEAAGRPGDISGGGIALGIGPVVFPQFLDRPQLVLRDSANRLTLNEFQRWGGTVQDDFIRVWAENLAWLLNTSRIVIFPSETRMSVDFRVTAEVVSFEGTPDNAATLKVRWAVMDERLERSLSSHDAVYRCPVSAPAPTAQTKRGEQALSDQRTEAVVAAMSRCLGDFSRDVADEVRRLPKLVTPSPDTPSPIVGD